MGGLLQGPGGTVEILTRGVGGAVAEVAQRVWRMALEHFPYHDHRLRTPPCDPGAVVAEELPGTHRASIPPGPAEFLLDRAGPGGLQAVLRGGSEPAALRWRAIGFVEEPQSPRSFEPIIAFGPQSLVLGSPHLIDRLFEGLGYMELVLHDFRVQGLSRHRFGIGREPSVATATQLRKLPSPSEGWAFSAEARTR